MRRKKKRFSKKKDRIYAGHWLQYSPYTAALGYDKYYVERANEVLDILNQYKAEWEVWGIDDNSLKIFATLLTKRFEDFINEIGLWQVFIQYNQQQFSYYLPFYDLSDYDPDYLNPVDFSYQLWHVISAFDEDWYAPDRPFLLEIGQQVYDLLEPKIEQAPTTDFYEKFFDLRKKDGFFDVKNCLIFLVHNSYLLGAGAFAPVIAKKQAELSTDAMGLSSYMMFQNEYLYQRASNWGGLSARQWLVGVIQATDELKEKILDTWKMVISVFIYDEQDEQYYFYRHHSLGTPFKVEKPSFKMQKEVALLKYHLMTLVNWGGEWWMSGGNLPLPNEAKDIVEKEFGNKEPSFFAYSPEIQQKNYDHITEMVERYENFGNSRTYLFDTMQEFEQHNTDVVRFWRKELNRRRRAAGEPEEIYPPLKPNHSELPIVEEPGVGYLLNPAIGMLIFRGHLAVEKLAQLEHPTEDQRWELFDRLFEYNYHPDVIALLVQRYPLHHLPNPFGDSKVDIAKNLTYLRAFRHSDQYEQSPPVTIYKE